MSILIRPARPADAPLILRFIRELASYERAADQVRATEEGLVSLLFSPTPRGFCEIAEMAGAPVGFMLWFYSVSTWEGRAGIFLEDLYVTPGARGAGVGRALLKRLAERCVAEDLGRLEWRVLDWNAPAIAFYDAIGSEPLDEWMTRRLSGRALAELAASNTPLRSGKPFGS